MTIAEDRILAIHLNAIDRIHGTYQHVSINWINSCKGNTSAGMNLNVPAHMFSRSRRISVSV